jgi:hypothetical protein
LERKKEITIEGERRYKERENNRRRGERKREKTRYGETNIRREGEKDKDRKKGD